MVVITQGSGFGSGSCVDVEPTGERKHEFIICEITHDILDSTL